MPIVPTEPTGRAPRSVRQMLRRRAIPLLVTLVAAACALALAGSSPRAGAAGAAQELADAVVLPHGATVLPGLPRGAALVVARTPAPCASPAWSQAQCPVWASARRFVAVATSLPAAVAEFSEMRLAGATTALRGSITFPWGP